ncbi:MULTISPECIES: DUF6491 family protein [unclassified Caulobacter]|uniref:DUF6491 family protein n=1 Tax=unclassified Caulobacter TaxID=2648921 RepID=UPI0004A7006A|nr:DUF6491 family protein [Caulobacter sp. UNC358MFTsu5.1]
MQRMFLVLAASAAALTSFASPAVEASSRKVDPSQCFRTERMANWASDDDRNIYVKLNTGAVFQVTLKGDCPGLTTYRVLSFDTDFTDQMCNGRPATVITRSGAGPLHCAVQSIRALTPEEASALPDKQRP